MPLKAIRTHRGARFCYTDEERADLARAREVWMVYSDNTPLLMVGLVPYSILGNAQYVWMKLIAHPTRGELRELLRLGPEWLERQGYLTARVRGDCASRFASAFGFTKQPSLGADAMERRTGL